MSTATAKFEEFCIPQSLPDLYEIVDGQVKERIVGARQLTITNRLSVMLSVFVNERLLGQVVTEGIFKLGDGANLRRPDIAYVSAERWPIDLEGPETNAWEVVPDLVVEVVSPTNSYNEIHEKTQEYFSVGVRQLWIVADRTRTIQVFDRPSAMLQYGMNDTLTAGAVLPGFELPIANLFSKRYA